MAPLCMFRDAAPSTHLHTDEANERTNKTLKLSFLQFARQLCHVGTEYVGTVGRECNYCRVLYIPKPHGGSESNQSNPVVRFPAQWVRFPRFSVTEVCTVRSTLLD